MSGYDRYPRRYGDDRRAGGSRSLGVYSSGVSKRDENGGGGYREGGGRAQYGSGRGRGYGGRGRRNRTEPTPTKEDLDADLDNWKLKDKKTGGEMLDKDLDSYKLEVKEDVPRVKEAVIVKEDLTVEEKVAPAQLPEEPIGDEAKPSGDKKPEV